MLVGEALHRRQDTRIASGIGHRRKKLRAGGVAVGMRGDVAAHAIAKFVIAHEAGDHRHDMATLAVSDAVEGGVDLGFAR